MEHIVIQRLGHQGDGIADGPVYAPLTLPGEVVEGTRDGARLTDIRIVTPSVDRVKPPCKHYRSCGGCQLQHARDEFVADWKRAVVQTALTAQRLDAVLPPILTSPTQSRRRAGFSVRRTKAGALAGFHGRASDSITEVPECQLIHPDLLVALPFARRLAELAASRKAEMTVQATRTAGGLDIAVTGGKPVDAALRARLASEVEAAGFARLTWEDEVIALRAPARVAMGRAWVTPPPGAFLQATDAGEAALVAQVRGIVGNAARVVDLFAGCGTFALPLAETAEVHAVEGESEMLRALDRGWRDAEGLKRVSTEARDLFRRPLMPDELRRFDAAVIDPPRAGAEAQVAALAQSRVPVIAYVSCNPVTFARDARVLVDAGWRLDVVQVVDQFRWSSHVELVARFALPHI